MAHKHTFRIATDGTVAVQRCVEGARLPKTNVNLIEGVEELRFKLAIKNQ